MSKIKNWMMEIEYFCDECWGDAIDAITLEDTTADDTVSRAEHYFKSDEAGRYARRYW